VVHPIQAHQSTIQVNDENHMANECNGGARGRITRGMKRRKKQARYLPGTTIAIPRRR
jgi:hypothetical protein